MPPPPSIIERPPNAYLEVFSKVAKEKLKIDFVIKPDKDSVNAKYIYDGAYSLHQYTLSLADEGSLKNIVEIQNQDGFISNGTFMSYIGGNFFRMSYKVSAPIVKNLKLSLSGNAIKTTTYSDSVLCFYGSLRNFSIKYNGSDTNAVFCSVNEVYDGNKPVPSTLPMNIALVKKRKTLHLLVLSVDTPNVKLGPDVLYKLLK